MKPLRRMPFLGTGLILWLLASLCQTPGAPKRKLSLDDLAKIREVRNPQIAPDGSWVAYEVRVADLKSDQLNTDLWMTSWDGATSLQLTHTKQNETQPRWSPDGRYLAFLSSRQEEDGAAQVWLLDRSGGEARQLTHFEGSVSNYAFSPDGSQLALIASDPDPKKKQDPEKTAPPIVIDRYQFKQDRVGYLEHRRKHLYLVTVDSGKAEILTPGDFDEALPSWSPDGRSIAFSSKRDGDPDRHINWDLFLIEASPGAEARQLTTFAGRDSSPNWGTPAVWSPDGRQLAYLQGQGPEWVFYDLPQIAVLSIDGGPARLLSPKLDRPASKLAWSQDGTGIFSLVEDDRSRYLARVPVHGGPIERLSQDPGVAQSLAIGPGDKLVATLTTPHQPFEVASWEPSGWRLLSSQNKELLNQLDLGAVEGLSFKSRDGTPVNGMLTKPPGFEAGKRYPTVAYIHGGPVSQDGYEFDFIWQILAAHGYVVVAPNYRGSSGRGHDFSRVIHGDWGNLEVQDVLAAVDALVANGIANPERLGIGGWSYGGITTNHVVAKDGRFKAAVSGAGIANVLTGYGTDQYIRQYETELGRPWENLDTYLRISFPFLHADRIKTPTLFLCGEKDFNVPLINSEQMYQALRSLEIPTELVIYPGQHHTLNKPSYQRDRLERYLDWFDRHLLSNKKTSLQ